MKDSYEDIINLPHHVSQKYPQMPLAERAAQFSPFAAIRGHDEAIMDTQRRTLSEVEHQIEYQDDWETEQ